MSGRNYSKGIIYLCNAIKVYRFKIFQMKIFRTVRNRSHLSGVTRYVP